MIKSAITVVLFFIYVRKMSYIISKKCENEKSFYLLLCENEKSFWSKLCENEKSLSMKFNETWRLILLFYLYRDFLSSTLDK